MSLRKNRYAFVIDVSRCIDCRACLVACSVENHVPNEHTRIWVKAPEIEGSFPKLIRSFVPYNCMHCENPPCVEVCVSGATYKDKISGLVKVDQDACIGCGYCVEACPYKVRYIDEKRGVVDKCNACEQRITMNQQPACVATCLGHSRMFGDLNDPNSDVVKALKDAKTIQVLNLEYQPSKSTQPQIFYINGDVQKSSLQPQMPTYTFSEQAWKDFLIPAVAAGVGLSFLGQAIMFTKQLMQGESEYEEQ